MKKTHRKDKEKLKADLLISLKDNLGIVSDSCKECKISRLSFYNLVNSDEEFANAVKEIEDDTLDFVEGKLFKRIAEGSDSSIFFYLNNKGKRRGYNTNDNEAKEEHTPITINLNGIEFNKEAK
jgi:hypothetical protein